MIPSSLLTLKDSKKQQKIKRRDSGYFWSKVGEDGNIVYSTIDVEPGEIKDMGYGSVGDETQRYVWIVSASWK